MRAGIIPSALLLAGCLNASMVQAQTAIPVQVQTLDEVLVAAERSAPAEVASLNTSTVAAEVTAVVKEVLAEVGEEIQPDQALLQLDDRDYQLALNQARANLEAARAQKEQADARLERAQELGAKNYLSADDLQARETDAAVGAAQILVNEASVAIAQRNLQKCRITAPFDGVVVERWAQVGAFVTPGTPLFDLVQTKGLELDAEIPDELADSLTRAADMRFVSRGESWPVRLLRLSPVIDTEQRSRRARFGFTGESPAVGRSGEIVWRVDKGLLPVNLVVRRNGQLGIFLNRGGIAVFEPLPNAQEGRPVPVDLPLDSEIVVQGRERLQDGDRIDARR